MKTGTSSLASVTLAIGIVALVSVLHIQIASTASGLRCRSGRAWGRHWRGCPVRQSDTMELVFFNVGKEDFEEAEEVEDGLGPRMNLDSCAGCHSQPDIGGSSPAVNPQMEFASKDGGKDTVRPFLSLNGPVREARFVRNPDGSPDGGVHALFTVSGRSQAGPCKLEQPEFAGQMSLGNVVFRIPTPTFGAGLIEMIPDSAILANQNADSAAKSALGIRGRANFILPGHTVSGQDEQQRQRWNRGAVWVEGPEQVPAALLG